MGVAGSALSSAGRALGGIGGRTGRLIGAVQSMLLSDWPVTTVAIGSIALLGLGMASIGMPESHHDKC